MADQLSEEQISELKKAYALFDKNADGKITADELGAIIRSQGQYPTEAEVINLIKQVDVDGNGTINFSEFLTIMAAKINDAFSEEELVDAFKLLDTNKDGTVSVEELKVVMVRLDNKLTDADVNEMFRKADINNDGRINYEEFVKMMRGG